MSQPQSAPAPQTFNIELPADLEAVYANFAIINHAPSEVVIDFARLLPNVPRIRVYARVVMTPMNAKLLHRALGENLSKYEAQFGEIKTYEEGFAPDRPLGFKR
jgi:hypothetical protein